MKQLVVIVTALTLTACGSVSEVVPIGRESFMVESHGVAGNGASATEKAKAFQTATAHCTKLGKEFQPISTSQTEAGWGRPPSAEVQFRCLQIGDPELQRPTLQPIPAVVIENRSK